MPESAMVECFREAEKACSVEGWTALDRAIEFIRQELCEPVPSLYGCKTWWQVLRKSGQFERRREVGSAKTRSHAFYRSLV